MQKRHLKGGAFRIIKPSSSSGGGTRTHNPSIGLCIFGWFRLFGSLALYRPSVGVGGGIPFGCFGTACCLSVAPSLTVYALANPESSFVMTRRRYTGRWTAVTLCAVATGAASGFGGPESVRADAVPLAARCADAGVRPLPLLRGHLNLNRAPGFSVPELIVHFRTPGLPRECESRFQRTVAVSVGVKLRGRPGILSIGRYFRPVEWLTFVVGFKAKGPERKGLVGGIAFSEKLPCTEKLIGQVRYRVTTNSGLLRERIAPFRPSFAHCGAAAS
jgi:hypothetical protein